MDIANTGQSLLDRGREIVQKVTWIVNEDLARAEFVRDNAPSDLKVSSVVNDQIKRLAGASPAAGAWLDEYDRYTGAHGTALLVSYPILAAQLFDFKGAVVRSFQFTNRAVQWVRLAGGGFSGTLGGEIVNQTERLGNAASEFFGTDGRPGGGPSGFTKLILTVAAMFAGAWAVSSFLKSR